MATGNAAADEHDRARSYSANLTGDQQVPPVETDASGYATFEANEDEMIVEYEVHVESICNVTQAHVHLGEEGENGPVVAWLYPEDAQEPELIEGRFDGTLAEGTITEDDLVGPLEGASAEEAVEMLKDEGAYVNVHTEQHPDGEIRGQIMPDEMPEEESEGDGSEDGRDDEEETNTLTVNLANDDVDGVEITVQRTGGPDVEPETTSKASAGGQASFELEPGHYYADAEGYVGTLTAINVTEGDVEITLQNESGATVRVKVTDAETGEPIEGATIEGVCNLHYSGGDSYITGETDENGVAMAQAGVTPTACDTRVSAEGYEDAHVRVHVPDDDELTVELVPEAAAGGDSGDETDDDTTDGSSDTKDKKTEKDPNYP